MLVLGRGGGLEPPGRGGGAEDVDTWQVSTSAHQLACMPQPDAYSPIHSKNSKKHRCLVLLVLLLKELSSGLVCMSCCCKGHCE